MVGDGCAQPQASGVSDLAAVVGQAIGLHAERIQAAQPGKRHSRSPWQAECLPYPNLAQVSSFGSDISDFLNSAPELCGVFGCRRTLWH
jgi:hypothetical protein